MCLQCQWRSFRLFCAMTWGHRTRTRSLWLPTTACRVPPSAIPLQCGGQWPWSLFTPSVSECAMRSWSSEMQWIKVDLIFISFVMLVWRRNTLYYRNPADVFDHPLCIERQDCVPKYRNRSGSNALQRLHGGILVRFYCTPTIYTAAFTHHLQQSLVTTD